METSTQTHKSGWWTAYFLLLLLSAVGSMIFGPHSPFTMFTFIFNSFGLVGLWGFLHDKAIGWRPFWVSYFMLMLLGAAFILGPGLWHGLRKDLALLFFLSAGALLSAPQWFAIWRYTFRSPHIWQSESQAAA